MSVNLNNTISTSLLERASKQEDQPSLGSSPIDNKTLMNLWDASVAQKVLRRPGACPSNGPP